MKTTEADVRLAISQFLQGDMVYVKAHPLESGRGKLKKRTPRRIGHTQDHLFQVEIIGKPDNVHQLKFLTLADNPPVVMSQALIAIKGVIEKVLPDWQQWDGLVAEIEAGRDATMGDVRATFQQLAENVRVLFVVTG